MKCQVLDVSQNDIAEIPADIAKMTNLEVVRLLDLVIEDTETTRAIPRPASHPPREDEGN